MENLADLEAEKEKLILELSALKKQIQKEMGYMETQYSPNAILQRTTETLRKKYLTPKNLLIAGGVVAGWLVLRYVTHQKKAKRQTLVAPASKNKAITLKTAPQTSFAGNLVKELIWTITLEVIRKKVTEYVNKTNKK